MGQLLVVNTGSSSLRYDVFEVKHSGGGGGRRAGDARDRPRRIARGHVQEIGGADGQVRHEAFGGDTVDRPSTVPTSAVAFDLMLSLLDEHGPRLDELMAIGHRVVHGGGHFDAPTLVDSDVEESIDDLSRFAPLHNPPALAGIRELRVRRPDAPQYAIFDTAFHRTLPAAAATYALPFAMSEQGVRRYGFHGISHAYVTREAARFLGVEVDDVQLVICHIGNGVSVTAVRDGRSVDTSMGLTPLQGAVMGTRCGDLDPAAVTFLMREQELDADAVERLLNRESGLKGMCGESDLRRVRALAESGDTRALLALDVYAHRLRCYIGAYVAQLPGVHALVFTAGVGEGDSSMRASVAGPLGHLGFTIDGARNALAVGPSDVTRIDDGTRDQAVLVVPTDEGLEMAIEIVAARLLS